MITSVIHTIPARIAHSSAFAPSVGDTFSSDSRTIFTGNAPLLRSSDSFLASSRENFPLICAAPPQILSWIVGAVTGCGSSPINIATGFPMYFSEIRQKISLPFSLKLIDTVGSPVGEDVTSASLKNAAFKISFVCGSIAGSRVGALCANTSSKE